MDRNNRLIHYMLGILSVLASAILFGCMPIFCYLPLQEGLSILGILTYRFGVTSIILFFVVSYQGTFKIGWQAVKHIFLLSWIGYGITAFLLFSSYQYIPSGISTTLHFSYPVFVLVLGILWYKEKICAYQMITVFFCTIGVILICDWNSFGVVQGYILALLSGVTYAFYIVYADHHTKNIPLWALTFYLSLFAFIPTAGLAWWYETPVFSISTAAMLSLGALSITASTLAIGLFQLGLKWVGGPMAAIGSMFEPITSLVIGGIFLAESISALATAGCILILVAVGISTISEWWLVKKSEPQ